MVLGCCLCCWKLPARKDSKPLIIDILEVIKDEAWSDFRSNFGSFRRKWLKRSDYEIDVPENYFIFNPVGEPRLENVEDWKGPHFGNGQVISPNNIARENQQQHDVNDTAKKPDNEEEEEVKTDNLKKVISLDTTFSNGTDEKQTYQFKFSKTRSTRVEVTYQKGFSFGEKTNITLGLPKKIADCSLGLLAERRLEIKKSRGESFDESVTMEATSDITVLPNSKYVAQVQLEERTINTRFAITIRMSMPQGHVPVSIRRKSDKVQVFVDSIQDLPYLFIGDEGSGAAFNRCSGVVNEKGAVAQDKVDFQVEGFIQGNIASDHNISLTSV